MNIINDYLTFLNEQTFGVQPALPTQVPQASRMQTAMVSKQPVAPNVPVSPQVKKQRTTTGVGRGHGRRPVAKQKANPIQYFNYMIMSTKIIKQSEIFRRNCYNQNCEQYEIGTGARVACKDRCDIETCKKIISMLKATSSKCDTSDNPDKCKVRYLQLIQLYQEKLNQISSKFIRSNKSKKLNG